VTMAGLDFILGPDVGPYVLGMGVIVMGYFINKYDN